ncbi:MAG TPA: hypothetical protein P5121_23135 [Caldilineaceae bacterium]|nr:hypothetical protein [Caldilineaceae bacterium]
MSEWQYDLVSFVDRIEEAAKIEEYARLLLDDRLIHPRTVIFTGAHGIGKSWLLSHLHQHLSTWNNLRLLMIDLATFSGTRDLSCVMHDIIAHANHKLFDRPIAAERSFAQSAAELIQEIKRVVLPNRPLVVMLDSVYESPWELLGLLENHILAPLIVERNVFIVMAGRGRPYPFKAIDLRQRAEFITLQPFAQNWTREQLSKISLPPQTAFNDIHLRSHGNPKANRLLAQSNDLHSMTAQLLTDMLTPIPSEDYHKLWDYLLALSVPRFFDYSVIPPILAAYFDDEAWLVKQRRDIREIADALIASGYAYWDSELSFYTLDTPTRYWCLDYLKLEDPERWRRTTQAQLRLLQQWVEEAPQSQLFWQAEIDYHDQEIRDMTDSDA